MEISIIIRFKDEQKYIGAVLEAVRNQNFPSNKYEIIAVDNNSLDKSRSIAEEYVDKILDIDNYYPGFALNQAIEAAKGKYICVLSAHTIPANSNWLYSLHNHMGKKELLAVYGAQQYPSTSKFLSKCVLDHFSTLQPRQEFTDSDFWNANSMFSKEVWSKQPFDEVVFELEDHYWTKKLLGQGGYIAFEPTALVYHYGHTERLDRTHLSSINISNIELIKKSLKDLTNSNASWPLVMKAGLTLNSLSPHPLIKESVNIIGEIFINHSDFDVRWRMAFVLGKIPTEKSAQYLANGLNDSSLYPKDAAAWSLGQLKYHAVKPILSYLKKYPDVDSSFPALSLALTQNTTALEKAIKCLKKEFRSETLSRRINATYISGEIADLGITKEFSQELATSLQTRTHPNELRAICWAIGCHVSLDPINFPINAIIQLSKAHPDPLVRFEAITAIGRLIKMRDSSSAVKILFESLEDSHSRVRYGAVQALKSNRKSAAVKIKVEKAARSLENDFGCKYELNLLLS